MAAGLLLSGLFWITLAAMAPAWVVAVVAVASSLAAVLLLSRGL
jgi:hypothetical protein